MKTMLNKLLVLCALHHVSSAFIVPTTKTATSSTALHTTLGGDLGYNDPSSVAMHRLSSRDVRSRYDVRPRDVMREPRNVDLFSSGSVHPLGAPFRERGGEMTLAPGAYADSRTHSRSGLEAYKTLQGGSRQTWDAPYDGWNDQIEVYMDTEGRPLDAEFELYQGPNNAPQKVKVYSENGARNPFRALVDAPVGKDHSISVKNTGPMAFPIRTSRIQGRRKSAFDGVESMPRGDDIQGGSLKTYAFDDYAVQSVQVSLRTDGMPLMAVVELWQGPNSVKQLAEIYSDDGYSKPFNMIVDMAGYGSTIAVRNAGPLTFPMTASVEPVF